MQHLDDHIRLVDKWQRGFPLVPQPFAVIGEGSDMAERDVLDCLKEMKRKGIISRLGVTVRPNTAGASTLAAMRVSEAQLEAVAQVVNCEPGVNHNYERDHDFNLWFVATGCNRQAVAQCLARIEEETGHEVLDLPLEQSYFIDLGFSILDGSRQAPALTDQRKPSEFPVSDMEKQVLASLQNGLPLEPRPFQALAEKIGINEQSVLDHLQSLIAKGVITRFGLILRHRELGFTENAMVVWDIPDSDVDEIGALFSSEPFVTLCYRRPRRKPDWPYNLFCMIHGRQRRTVFSQIYQLQKLAKVNGEQTAILFSKRRFKQRGAQLSAA